jgi:antitoxin YefM
VTSIPIAQAKARLSEIVDDAVVTQERVTITRHGRPAVVLLSVDDLEALEDSLYWQDQPDIAGDIAVARAEAAAGELTGEDAARRRYQGRRHQ